MNADEYITYFLETGKLHENLKSSFLKEKIEKNSGVELSIDFRKIMDKSFQTDLREWTKFNSVQIELLAANIPEFTKMLNKIFLLTILHYSEKYISYFNSNRIKKAIKKHNSDMIYFVRLTSTIYVTLALDEKGENNITPKDSIIYKNLILIVRSHKAELDSLLTKIDKISQQTAHGNVGEINEKLEQPRGKTELVIEGLNEYKFSEFLRKHNFKSEDIYQLINKHSGRELMPYTIALLHEIEYLDYFFNEYTNTKKDGFKKLGKVFSITERRIRGNINILNNGSTEDALQYTSPQYTKRVQTELKGIKRDG